MVERILNTECNSVKKPDFKVKFVTRLPQNRLSIKKYPFSKVALKKPPKRVNITIVGGGVNGCSVAAYLKANLQNKFSILILDDNDFLLEKFHNYTYKTEQSYMRSNYEFHLAPDGLPTLIDFARMNWSLLNKDEQEQVNLALSGERSIVPIDIFLAHSRFICDVMQLENNSYKAKVKKISRVSNNNIYELYTAHNDLVISDIVIVANGNIENLSIDEFIFRNVSPIYHSDFPLKNIEKKKFAVIGKGMASAHKVLRLLQKGADVDWFTGEKHTYQCSDCPTKYFRTEGLRYFEESDIEKRIFILRSSSGTMMPEFYYAFEKYLNLGCLKIKPYEYGLSSRQINKENKELNRFFDEYDHVYVSSGLSPNNEILISNVDYVDCFPILSNTLETSNNPGLFMVGNLASLSVGPASSTIDGSRMALEKMRFRLARLLSLPAPLPSPQKGFLPIGRIRC